MGRNVVVVGTQWGDEGKGKIVDLLTEKAAAAVSINAVYVPLRASWPSGTPNDRDREHLGKRDALDALGRAHLIWVRASSEVVYQRLDPALDDQDGSPADPAVIQPLPEIVVSTLPPDFSFSTASRSSPTSKDAVATGVSSIKTVPSAARSA